MESIDLSFCLCGCGEKVIKKRNKYIRGHNIRIKNPMKNKDTSDKVRKTKLGKEPWNKGKRGVQQAWNKGKKISECFDEEKVNKIKLKCGEPRRGKTYEEIYGVERSNELKEFYKKRMLGKTYEELFGKEKSIEMKQNSSSRFKGSNNPMFGIKSSDHHNWKGGISCEPYCEQWLTNDLKGYIKDRDGYKCQNPQCTKYSKNLCVHHINYNKKDCDPWNLITLCSSCNSAATFQRDWWECFYKEIIRRKGIYKNER